MAQHTAHEEEQHVAAAVGLHYRSHLCGLLCFLFLFDALHYDVGHAEGEAEYHKAAGSHGGYEHRLIASAEEVDAGDAAGTQKLADAGDAV